MDSAGIGNRILWLTALVLGAFGVIVAAASLVLRRTGRSPRPLLTKYGAWFVIAPVIVLPLVYSRMLFQVVVMLLSLQCIREFSRVTGLWADRGMMRISYLLAAGLYVPVLARWYGLHQAGPLMVMGVLLLVPIFRGHYEHMVQKVSLSILAVLYFGWFLSHLAYMRNLDGGIGYVFLLVLLVCCNDAFAFLWGRWVGRHKLSPRISPNKTVEGAALAAVSVIGVAFLMRGVLPKRRNPPSRWGRRERMARRAVRRYR